MRRTSAFFRANGACVTAAVVRVRPAFANEGRYFVRVPEGASATRVLVVVVLVLLRRA